MDDYKMKFQIDLRTRNSHPIIMSSQPRSPIHDHVLKPFSSPLHSPYRTLSISTKYSPETANLTKGANTDSLQESAIIDDQSGSFSKEI